MHDNSKAAISKVPEITLAFWVIKILATTLGETGGTPFPCRWNSVIW
ncbi:hypothetical protein LEO73_13850 [Aeromonas dhakensis]|nr:hypothetical protein LEO73_13850 [Aeromonas dhakensis]